jgi:hypothetical protein
METRQQITQYEITQPAKIGDAPGSAHMFVALYSIPKGHKSSSNLNELTLVTSKRIQFKFKPQWNDSIEFQNTHTQFKPQWNETIPVQTSME